eukprot:242436-Lingulodinium_polyedra.AAC.1
MPTRPGRPRRLAAAQRRCCPLETGAQRRAARRLAAHCRWLAMSGPYGRRPQQGTSRAGRIAICA